MNVDAGEPARTVVRAGRAILGITRTELDRLDHKVNTALDDMCAQISTSLTQIKHVLSVLESRITAHEARIAALESKITNVPE